MANTTKIPAFELGRFAAVAIGASTGAPAQVEEIIRGLPADLPVPIFIAQHMPPTFTKSFANRLNCAGPLTVVHAEDGMPVLPATVYVGVGHQHLRVRRGGAGRARVEVAKQPKELVYKPSVDELFLSCVEVYRNRVLAIVLSGIGSDGTKGARQIHRLGGVVLTQAAQTCVVYGMPRSCDAAGVSAAQLNPEQLRQAILQLSPNHRHQAIV